MNKKLLSAIAFLMLISFNTIVAQSQSLTKTPSVTYSSNLDTPLNSNETKMLKEVYADKLDEYILSKPNRLLSVKNILRNRVAIIELPAEKLKGLKNLSEVPLFNHYNSKLKRDTTVDKNNFNPLKYEFDFYSRRASFIRIDNTNSVIHIKSQMQ